MSRNSEICTEHVPLAAMDTKMYTYTSKHMIYVHVCIYTYIYIYIYEHVPLAAGAFYLYVYMYVYIYIYNIHIAEQLSIHVYLAQEHVVKIEVWNEHIWMHKYISPPCRGGAEGARPCRGPGGIMTKMTNMVKTNMPIRKHKNGPQVPCEQTICRIIVFCLVCYGMVCHGITCCIMSCYAMLCYAMICYAMLG